MSKRNDSKGVYQIPPKGKHLISTIFPILTTMTRLITSCISLTPMFHHIYFSFIYSRWKLSPMDVQSRDRWVEYSKAKDEMLKYTDSDTAPWVHVHADSKKLARLNCISHLLSTIPYQDLTPQAVRIINTSAPPSIYRASKSCPSIPIIPLTCIFFPLNLDSFPFPKWFFCVDHPSTP